MKELQTDVKDPMDLSSNPLELVVGDPVVYQFSKGRKTGLVGRVFQENQVSKVEIHFFDKTKHVVKANDVDNLHALFFKTARGVKVQMRFSYKEITSLFKENRFFGKSYNDIGKSSVNNLMLGGKTAVIDNVQLVSQKGDTPEIHTVSGRFNLSVRNGSIYVNLDIAQKNLDLTSYMGKEFTKAQQKQLEQNGELGLVKDFVVKNGDRAGELFNLWIGVDKQLNKIVSRPERSVRIEQYRGKRLTQEEKTALQSGKGVLLTLPKKDGGSYQSYVMVSAASTAADGMRSFSYEQAKKFGLLPKAVTEKKKTRSKGLSR